MSNSIEKVSPVVGVEVSGIDRSVSTDLERVNLLGEALAEHGVLIFRDQHLPPDQHIAFSRCFGALETHVISHALVDGHPEIYVVSNIVEDGKPQGRPYAGTYWHSDLSYTATPTMGRCWSSSSSTLRNPPLSTATNGAFTISCSGTIAARFTTRFAITGTRRATCTGRRSAVMCRIEERIHGIHKTL
jgi:alpha-ketoglutarate-dependent taurine dioxygenase